MKCTLYTILIAIILCGCSSDDNIIAEEKPIGIEGTWALIGISYNNPYIDEYVEFHDVFSYMVIENNLIENYENYDDDMCFEYIGGILYGDDFEVFEKISTAKYNLVDEIYRIIEIEILDPSAELGIDESGFYMQLKDDRLIVTHESCDGIGDDRYYQTYEYARVYEFENK